MKRKHSLFLLLPAIAMVTSGCDMLNNLLGKGKDDKDNTQQTGDDNTGGDDTGGGQQTVAVTNVTLNETSKTLDVGGSFTLVATVAPGDATNKNVTWTSSAPTVASVVNGVVTANAAGSATITVKTEDGNKSATCVVTVTGSQQQTNYGTETSPITVTQALAIANAECTASNTFTQQAITVSGKVKSILNEFTYESGPCFEFTITDNTTDMHVYRCHCTATQKEYMTENADIVITGFVKMNTKNNVSEMQFADNGSTGQCHIVNVTSQGAPTAQSITALSGIPESIIQGETLSVAGITATVLYSDGSSKTKNVERIELDTSVVGDAIQGTAHFGTLTKTFTIKVVAPADKVNGDFYRVKSQDEIVEGTYLIVYEGENGAGKVFSGVDAVNGFTSATCTGGHIEASDSHVKVQLETMDGGFAIKVLNGANANKYIGGKSGANSLNFDDAKTLNTISHDASSGADVITSNTAFLCYNKATDQQRFRYYKTNSQQPVHLYKLHEGPVAKTLQSITATVTKTVYTVDDQLDLTGLTVSGHYSDGSDAAITEGITTSLTAGHVMTATDTSLVVSVGGITTTITLTVNPKQEEGAVLTDISVTSSTHREFFVGDPFVGEQITATYDKGEPRVVTATYTGYDMSTAGTQTVTATYTENDVTKTATYDITVKVVPVLDGITITTQPTTTTYVAGQTFDPAGMVVTASYTGDKAAQAVIGYTFSTDALVAGTTSIEISYTEGGVTKTASVAITVTEPARATLPYTGAISGGALPEGWVGNGATFSTTFYALKDDNAYVSATKLIDAQSKIRVIVDCVANGTTKDSTVTVYGLDDDGNTISGAVATFTPVKGEASNAQLINQNSQEHSVMLEGTGITGVKVELTTKGHNLVLRSIKITEPPVMVSSVSLSETTMALEYPGSNGTLTATVSPDNAENSEVEWSVSEGSSVTVENGVVTPIAVGQSTVTATAKDGSGKSASCVVTVSASAKVLESISVTTNPGKTEYESGEIFNPAGMVVTANYEGGTSEPITDYTYSQNPLTAGTTSITISYGGKTATVAITVTAAKGSTVDNPYTISEVLEVCSSLGDSQWLPNRVYVQGIVKGYAASSNNKYTLKDDAGTEFIVMKSSLPAGDRACIGDTVVMEGWVEYYNSIYQMTGYNDGTHNDLPTTAKIVTRGTSTISLDSNSSANATVTFEATATNASNYTFTVEAKEGYQIANVKYDDKVVEGDNGSYTVKVLGNAKILVETVQSGQALPTTITKTITEMYTIAKEAAGGEEVLQKNVTSIALDSVITLSTTGEPNNGYIGASSGKPSDWRLYQAQNGNLIVSASAGYQINTIKVTFTVANSGALFNGSTQVKSNDVVTVNDDSITLTVGNSGDKTNGQIKVTAIEVVYIAK